MPPIPNLPGSIFFSNRPRWFFSCKICWAVPWFPPAIINNESLDDVSQQKSIGNTREYESYIHTYSSVADWLRPRDVTQCLKLGFLTCGMQYVLCGTLCGMCDSFNTECSDFFVIFLLSLSQNNRIINQPASQPSNRPTNQPTNKPTKQPVVESGKTMGGVLDAGNQKNCDSTNGIYCIVCSKCNKLYVGETGLSFRKRINIHRADVRLKKDTAVATYFNSWSCRATHLRVLYLEVLKNTGDITLNRIGRLEAERKWQLPLKTYSPFGLNTVPSPKDSGVTPYSATALLCNCGGGS